MPTMRLPRQLFVRSLSSASIRGFLDLGFTRVPCVLGRTGRRVLKREGDGATPFGRFGILSLLYRADRRSRPQANLPVASIEANDGWCDAPADRNYNRPVRHPYPESAERLWRDDHLYDVVGVLDYNISPRVRGRGSAIFLHICHPDGKPTAGCIAISAHDMKKLVGGFASKTILVVSA